MQGQIKPPALNDNMPPEEMERRVKEMMAASSDMEPIDQSSMKERDKESLKAG